MTERVFSFNTAATPGEERHTRPGGLTCRWLIASRKICATVSTAPNPKKTKVRRSYRSSIGFGADKLTHTRPITRSGVCFYNYLETEKCQKQSALLFYYPATADKRSPAVSQKAEKIPSFLTAYSSFLVNGKFSERIFMQIMIIYSLFWKNIHQTYWPFAFFVV